MARLRYGENAASSKPGNFSRWRFLLYCGMLILYIAVVPSRGGGRIYHVFQEVASTVAIYAWIRKILLNGPLRRILFLHGRIFLQDRGVARL